MALSALVVWAHGHAPGLVPSLTGAPFALFGIALSVVLSFRNGAGYERWWEARKAWGTLLAASRDLDRQTLILTSRGEAAVAARRRLCHLAIVFADELVRHLREGVSERARPRLLVPDEADRLAAAPNRPERVLRMMGETLAELRAAGTLGEAETLALNTTMRDFTMPWPRANGCAARRCRSPTPCCCAEPPVCSASSCPFGFADARGMPPPSRRASSASTP